MLLRRENSWKLIICKVRAAKVQILCFQSHIPLAGKCFEKVYYIYIFISDLKDIILHSPSNTCRNNFHSFLENRRGEVHIYMAVLMLNVFPMSLH